MKKIMKISLLVKYSPFFILLTRVCTAESSSKLSQLDLRPEAILFRFFAKSFAPEVGAVSPDCQRDSDLYRTDLANYSPWALRMYDASTKIPSGLITGNTIQLGNYDECLNVKSNHGFVGKACNANIQILIANKNPVKDVDRDEPDVRDLLINVAMASGLTNWTFGSFVPYEWLWCVPSSCSTRDVTRTIEMGLDDLKKSPVVDFFVFIQDYSCHTRESDRPIFDLADWSYVCLLILFGCLVLLSTLYDLMKHYIPDKPDSQETRQKILCAFSAYTNGKMVLDTERGANAMACIDGLRFLSICWIIFSHTYYLKAVGVGLDFLSIPTMHERFDSLLLLNGNIATDTFFLISGILLASTELARMEKNSDRYRFGIWNIYLRRYLRLTPTYAMVIGFYATLLYKIGNGPLWNEWIGINRDACRENWWTNILYVNNHVNISKMCMSQSWYLSVDVQLVLISPIFLYPMLGGGKNNRRLFPVIYISGLLASVLIPFFITYCNELTGTMLYYKNQEDVEKVYLQIYTKTYARAGPYLLGLGLGYLLRKIKPSDISIPTCFIVVGWILSITFGLVAVFGPRAMYFPEYDYNVIEAAFYAGFHRFVFALAVGWIIFASVFGFAGPVGAFLSWSLWVPLSKLTYPAYLTHFIVLLYNVGSTRTPDYITSYNVVLAFFGNLAMTLIISVILSLTCEIPLIRLTNMLLSRNQSSFLSKRSVVPAAFESTESIIEIYRSVNDGPYIVTRTYDNLVERCGGIAAEMNQRPIGWSSNVLNPNEDSSSNDLESKGTLRERHGDAQS